MPKSRRTGPQQNRPRLRSAAAVGTCKHCWGEVLWFKRPDGRYHPPMVSIGMILAVDEDTIHADSIVTEVQALIRHQCDPDDLDHVQKVKAEQEANVAEQIQRSREERAAREVTSTLADQAYRVALAVECPACLAEPQMRCLNLNRVMGRKGSEKQSVHTKWPHPDRTLVAEKEN